MKTKGNVFRQLEPIRGLSEIRLTELADLCRPEIFPIGADPLRSTSKNGQFFYLIKGELSTLLTDGSRRVMVGGCDMANWPIGYQTVLPVSSKAITEVEIVRVDFDLLDIMMTWDELASAGSKTPTAGEEPADWSTMTGAFNVQALTSGCLSQLPAAHIHELFQRFERIKTKRGQVMIRDGELGDSYYMIESGRCEVTKLVGGAQVILAQLRAGDSFGEEALVSETTRNATVTMKTDGTLLRLAKPDFIELLRTPLLHTVEWADAEQRVASGQALWLDVRYAAEFGQDGLPGALNIPLNEIRSAFDLLDKNKEYIVYCHSGRRSSAAAFLLAQYGLKAFWLRDGLVAEKVQS
ncbi:MAG: cyclic nucleotide-binding domain-containing protein [Azonexus sp.]